LASSPRHVSLDGMRVAAPAESVVTSWPLLPERERRAPAIQAVRRRLVTPSALRSRVAVHPRLPGRRDLEQLVDLLTAGCESELEIWGLLGVFDAPGLRHGRRQLWVSTQSGRYRLDLGYEQERVAVEMDGHRFHSTREQRERDMRRDAALAAVDWLTLRFSRDRLHGDVGGCRRDTLATLEARRRRRR
jgi:very-short-patch-repair endonuclease